MNKLKSQESSIKKESPIVEESLLIEVPEVAEAVEPVVVPEPAVVEAQQPSVTFDVSTPANPTQKVKAKTKPREFDRIVRGVEPTPSNPTQKSVGFDSFESKDKSVIFLSRYKICSVYIPRYMYDEDGDLVIKQDRYGDEEYLLIRFQDGAYEARNPLVIKALREHEAFNKSFFEGDYPEWLVEMFNKDQEYLRKERGAYEQGMIEV